MAVKIKQPKQLYLQKPVGQNNWKLWGDNDKILNVTNSVEHSDT